MKDRTETPFDCIAFKREAQAAIIRSDRRPQHRGTDRLVPASRGERAPSRMVFGDRPSKRGDNSVATARACATAARPPAIDGVSDANSVGMPKRTKVIQAHNAGDAVSLERLRRSSTSSRFPRARS